MHPVLIRLRWPVAARAVAAGVLTATLLGVLNVLNNVFLAPRGMSVIPGNLLNLGVDSAAPTWFSSLLLLGGSLSTAAAWRLTSGGGARGRIRHFWAVIAGTFLLLSIDEVAVIHERVGGRLGMLIAGPTDGFLRYNWVIVGVPFVALFAAAAVPFLIGLPRSTRLWFLTAGALFVSGAVGVEMVNSQIHATRGVDTLAYGLSTAFEEFLEMAGSGLFLVAVLRHIELGYGSLEIRIGSAEPREGSAPIDST